MDEDREGARPSPGGLADLCVAVLEEWSSPLVVCDGAGRLILANAGARDLWELAAVGAIEVRAEQVRWFAAEPGAGAGEPDPLFQALADGSTVSEWRALVPRDGEPRTALIEASPLHDPAGGIIGAVMKVLDVGDAGAEQLLYDYASDVLMLAEVSRVLAEISDPDEAAAMICTVALGATGAVAMMLWRRTGEELELAHHEAAIPIGDAERPGEPAHSGASIALARRETTIEPMTLPGTGAETLTAWHEPLMSGGQAIGVLSIVWPGIIDDPSRPAALVSSLAQHSAAALDRADLLRQLAEAARTDALTGVANRRVWVERLDQELLRADRGRHPLSLIMIDIDHFKRYNDSRGHAEGDRLLREAASAWSHRLRRTDLLARVGGEEFAVLLPDCPAEHLSTVAESLRAAMPGEQTCSVGAVTYDGHASAAALYEAADAALYRAKRAGRNRVEVGSAGGDRTAS